MQPVAIFAHVLTPLAMYDLLPRTLSAFFGLLLLGNNLMGATDSFFIHPLESSGQYFLKMNFIYTNFKRTTISFPVNLNSDNRSTIRDLKQAIVNARDAKKEDDDENITSDMLRLS